MRLLLDAKSKVLNHISNKVLNFLGSARPTDFSVKLRRSSGTDQVFVLCPLSFHLQSDKNRVHYSLTNDIDGHYKTCKKSFDGMYDTKTMIMIGSVTNHVLHTSQNSFYKWTKISILEIDIFDLKMIVKYDLEFFTLNSVSPLRVVAAQCKNICLRRADLAWQLSIYL